jgi:MFS family permease
VLVFLPESPVWLHKKGKVAEAHRSRQRLVGKVEGYDEEREYQVMAQEIQHSMTQTQQSSQYSWVACFKGTNLRRTLISTIPLSMQVSVGLLDIAHTRAYFWQNFVGVPLMFNVVYFFSLIGLSNAFTANLIITCVLLGGVLVSFYLVDKVGRRPLLLGGGVVMSLCVFCVGALGTQRLTSAMGGGMIALVAIWVAAYSVSCAPIGWIALVENSTPQLRTQTAGIAAVLQSCSGVVFVSKTGVIAAVKR